MVKVLNSCLNRFRGLISTKATGGVGKPIQLLILLYSNRMTIFFKMTVCYIYLEKMATLKFLMQNTTTELKLKNFFITKQVNNQELSLSKVVGFY